MVFICFRASRTILDVIGIILVKYYLKRMNMDPFQVHFHVFLNIFRVQVADDDDHSQNPLPPGPSHPGKK